MREGANGRGVRHGTGVHILRAAYLVVHQGRDRAGLRERYQVPAELPPKLLALVRKLAAVEGEGSSPRSRRLISKLDAIEGNYLSRRAQPAEPRSVGPSDDWPLCT